MTHNPTCYIESINHEASVCTKDMGNDTFSVTLYTGNRRKPVILSRKGLGKLAFSLQRVLYLSQEKNGGQSHE